MAKFSLKARSIVGGAISLAALAVTGAIYVTFLQGTTLGPDFVAALRSGEVRREEVKSVEVIVPPQGYDAFTAAEYDSLRRASTVTAPPAIAQLLAHLSGAGIGHVPQNHPVMIYRKYWKVNLVGGGFYYLYADILRDASSTVCYVSANKRDATNPNGATQYRVSDFQTMLPWVDEAGWTEMAEPGAGGNAR